MTTYTISKCECGALTGERCTWTGPTGETEIIEYMPEDLICSHVTAGYQSIGAAGSYPSNGAQRIRVELSCADRLLHIWEDGEQTEQIDPWVQRVREFDTEGMTEQIDLDDIEAKEEEERLTEAEHAADDRKDREGDFMNDGRR